MRAVEGFDSRTALDDFPDMREGLIRRLDNPLISPDEVFELELEGHLDAQDRPLGAGVGEVCLLPGRLRAGVYVYPVRRRHHRNERACRTLARP